MRGEKDIKPSYSFGCITDMNKSKHNYKLHLKYA